MKIQALASLFAVLIATPAFSQNVGFRVGIAPQESMTAAQVGVNNPPIVVPGFSAPIVMPFATAPVSGFGLMPAPLAVVRAGILPQAVFVQNPAGGLHQQPYHQPYQRRFAPGVVIVEAPRAHFGPPPTPVSNRDLAIRDFGRPLASVLTSAGETLYFNGGVTVFIQNGQVAGPR